MPITVAIVEDDARFAGEIKLLLDRSSDFSCVAVCLSAEHALQELPALRPQVILMDIHLPGVSGIDCVRRLKEQLPETEFSMLTAFEDYDGICQSIFAGASGYLLKGIPPDDLFRSIHEVHQGGSSMTAAIARKVINAFRQLDARPADSYGLSLREQEVLAALAKGHRYKQIAEDLGISYDTVRTHVGRIYKKFHVGCRSQAIQQLSLLPRNRVFIRR